MDYYSGMDGEGAQPQSYPQLVHNVVLKQRFRKNLVDNMVFTLLDFGLALGRKLLDTPPKTA